MSKDLYKAPEAELLDSDQLKQNEFYVVSKRKFAILFFATFGIYGVFWFYHHWKQYRIANDENILPALRAIFNIFFTHSLFKKINERKERVAPESKPWRHSEMATLYVVFSILSNFIDRVPIAANSILIEFLFLLPLPIFYWLLWDAQKIANLALSDPNGEANDSFSLWNYLWIVLGILLWIAMLVGIFAGLGYLDDF